MNCLEGKIAYDVVYLLAKKADGCSAEELRERLLCLMEEQIASLKKQTFLGQDDEDLREQGERLKLIREVSADFLAALKKEGR